MNTVANLAKENLTALHAYQSDTARGLLEYLQKQRIRGEKSPYSMHFHSSRSATFYKRIGDQSFFFHEPSNPTGEAQAQATDLLENPPGLIVVYSCGLGYLVCALASLLSQTRILLLEPDYDILFLALQTCDWRKLLSAPNLLFITGANAIREAETLLTQYAYLLQRGVRIIPGRILLDEEKSLLDSLNQICRQNRERTARCASSHSLDPECVGIVVTDSHRDLLGTLDTEMQKSGYTTRPVLRQKTHLRFVGNEIPIGDTLGAPLPGKVLVLSPSAFTSREWESLGEYGVQRKIWFFDDPFRFDLPSSFFSAMEHIYCFDPFLSQKLQEQTASPVTYMPEATSYPDGVPGFPPDTVPPILDITFVGSTGLQRFDQNLVAWLMENPPSLQTLRAQVKERLNKGMPLSYEEICALEIPFAGLSSGTRIRIVEDLVTFWVRCEYLTTLPEDHTLIFGDSGWSVETLTGSVRRIYAGRSLDFMAESPWVFQRSAINLNIFNVQCVNAPILRVYDIMACGGFLLSEYRPFFDSYFRIGEEMDVFRTPSELREKVNYYLAHPEQRENIARAGQKRVLEEHRFRDRFQKMRERELR